MVKIEKYEYEKDCYIIEIHLDEGTFQIVFGGTLDLYWRCNNLDSNEPQEFLITKENYYLYCLFDKLYENIKNYNFQDVFNDWYDKFIEEYGEHLRIQDRFEENPLCKNDIIDYHSDDFPYDEASSFHIEKLDETYKLTFYKSKEKDAINTYSVRIRNSGSRYNSFNLLFMQMYKDLLEYDPEYHQIHIEEYLFEQKRTRKKTQN